jgi:signal peptidase I
MPTASLQIPAVRFIEFKPQTPCKQKPNALPQKVLCIASNLVFWIVCISLVFGSVLFAVSRDPRKNYLGYRTYNVLTESMTPRADGSSPAGGFKKGAVIMVKMCKPSDIKVGDIITFNPNARDEENTLFLTHRVVEIKHELGGKEGIFFVTRGDANNSDDPPISSDMLIGKKIFHIAGMGGFLQTVRENLTMSIITIVCLFACIFMFRWYFSAPSKEQPKQSAQPVYA